MIDIIKAIRTVNSVRDMGVDWDELDINKEDPLGA
jgi:hypothetical protein